MQGLFPTKFSLFWRYSYPHTTVWEKVCEQRPQSRHPPLFCLLKSLSYCNLRIFNTTFSAYNISVPKECTISKICTLLTVGLPKLCSVSHTHFPLISLLALCYQKDSESRFSYRHKVTYWITIGNIFLPNLTNFNIFANQPPPIPEIIYLSFGKIHLVYKITMIFRCLIRKTLILSLLYYENTYMHVVEQQTVSCIHDQYIQGS